MPTADTRLTTRINEDTYWRLKALAVETRRTVQELVELALQQFLDSETIDA